LFRPSSCSSDPQVVVQTLKL